MSQRGSEQQVYLTCRWLVGNEGKEKNVEAIKLFGISQRLLEGPIVRVIAQGPANVTTHNMPNQERRV